MCGAWNPAEEQCCVECGAARWDGPGGQLQLRLLAALRTADLDATSIKQVRGTRDNSVIKACMLCCWHSSPSVQKKVPHRCLHAALRPVSHVLTSASLRCIAWHGMACVAHQAEAAVYVSDQFLTSDTGKLCSACSV